MGAGRGLVERSVGEGDGAGLGWGEGVAAGGGGGEEGPLAGDAADGEWRAVPVLVRVRVCVGDWPEAIWPKLSRRRRGRMRLPVMARVPAPVP